MDSVTTMRGSYDLALVALSILLSMFASYAALDLAGRVTSAQGRSRVAWLVCGATAMGLGIWAMQYVGMLALRMPMPVFYHVPTVGLSLLTAILASGVALFVVSRQRMESWHEVAGCLTMGAGIAAMHYVGMAAMRCPAEIVYDLRIVALSILLAVVIAAVALRLAFRVRDEKHVTRRKIVSMLVVGGAIPTMHYTGMWAATFHSSGKALDFTGALSVSSIRIVAISVSALFVLAAAIASSFFDRRSSLQRDSFRIGRERESYFQMMAEALPEILWSADLDGAHDYFNNRTFEYTGRAYEQMRGEGWYDSVHPDDLEEWVSKWKLALTAGKPYEMEYRLLGKDGKFRWFFGRAHPIRNADGAIIKWFGTCTDIENQKHNQQILEEQILERTTELADLNTRLQDEMIDKDFARKELDLQNEQMVSDLEKRSQRATMLAKMGELLQSCVTRDEVFAAALGYAPKIFPAARGAVALLNTDRSLGEVIGSWNDCELPARDFHPTDCWALRTGHPHLVLAGDPTARCSHAAGVTHTYLCVPILAQGETLGILHLQATDAEPRLNTAEMSFKTTFAGQVGLSIANIRLREALRMQSVRDALTGLYNRRYLEEVLDRETRRAGRAEQSMGVLMLDLDHFKHFNDTYGHDAGDAVLREAAAFLLQNVRAEDFVCRFGGEEFVVILPTADLHGSSLRAEALRAKMKDLTIMHQGKSLGLITFSVGVASFPEHGASPKELMAAADAALYHAKRAGRDRVVVATPKIPETATPLAAAQA